VRRILSILFGRKALILYFRLILGVMFIYAGAVKIIDPDGFAQSIYNYHLLPGWMINIFAVMLPWIEVVAGISIVFGIWLQGGALIISGLLLMFVCALGISLARGLDISCGCFTTNPVRDPINWLYMVRDSALLFMSGLVLFFDNNS